jgi:hypothetical protein
MPRWYEMGGNIPADWVTVQQEWTGTGESAARLAGSAFNIPVSRCEPWALSRKGRSSETEGGIL